LYHHLPDLICESAELYFYESLLQQPANNRQEVVAADLEGTLSAGATWRGLRGYLEANEQNALFKQFMRPRLPQIILFRLGLLRNEQAFKEQWVLDMYQLFVGYTEAQFAEVAGFVVTQELWPQRRPSVVAECLAHQQNGRRLILVTGVNEPVLARFAARLNGAEAIGTPLEWTDGVFTGCTVGPMNTSQNKVEQLQPFTRNGRIHTAYGDTAADIPMLQLAKNGVAVCPDKVLQAADAQYGWRTLTCETAVVPS
jgi:phosphoserine phosphatase